MQDELLLFILIFYLCSIWKHVALIIYLFSAVSSRPSILQCSFRSAPLAYFFAKSLRVVPTIRIIIIQGSSNNIYMRFSGSVQNI